MPALCVELTGCTPNFMQNTAITQLQKKLASFRQNKCAERSMEVFPAFNETYQTIDRPTDGHKRVDI